ncbi:MAG: hypothetical protein AB9842_06530 [Bacteroidales bacterium]
MRIISLLTFTLIVIFASAQPNIRPGYIVEQNGNVVTGFIDYQNWEFNPDFIHFGLMADSVNTICSVEHIKAFAVEGEHYVKYILEVNTGPEETGDLNFSPQLTTKIDTVFLRMLISGPKSLYYLKQKGGRECFYIMQDNKPELLIYQRYLKNINQLNENNVIIANNKFIGQLSLYLQECSEITKLFEKVKYTQYSLTRLFKQYYKCTGQEMDYAEPEEKTLDEWGVFAGATLTKLSFRGGAAPYVSKSTYPASLNLTGGVFYNHILKRTMGKWSINNELQYARYKTEGVYKEFQHSNWYNTTTTDFDFTYLKLNNMIRYTRWVKGLHCHLELGISNGIILNMTNRRVDENVFYGTVHITEGEAIESLRKHEQSLLVGIGARYRRFSASVRLEKGNGMSDYSWLRSNTQRQSVILSYNLKGAGKRQ